MANEKSVTRNRNYGDDNDDACSRKPIMTCDDGGVPRPWLDLTHDVMFSVTMHLGVIDFVAFKGVCMSWRSFASSNMDTFMSSRPPMFMSTDDGENDDDVECCCHLEDFEGRGFKIVLRHSAGAICLGITCGYLIMYGTKTRDFWLVNLITRHELHFPDVLKEVIFHAMLRKVRAILVFSPSIPLSGCWVFLVLNRYTHEIWFSRVGSTWNHVSSTVPINDLHYFGGKIYTLHASDFDCETKIIGMMRLNPKESKLTLLETQNFPSVTRLGFVCSGENLYLLECLPAQIGYMLPRHRFKAHKLDFGEMKWVVPDEITRQQHAFFLSYMSHGAVVRPYLWWQSQFRSTSELSGNESFFDSDKWYFPHECQNINRMDE